MLKKERKKCGCVRPAQKMQATRLGRKLPASAVRRIGDRTPGHQGKWRHAQSRISALLNTRTPDLCLYTAECQVVTTACFQDYRDGKWSGGNRTPVRTSDDLTPSDRDGLGNENPCGLAGCSRETCSTWGNERKLTPPKLRN